MSSHTISLFGNQPNHPVFGDRNRIESGLFVFSKNSKLGPPSFTRLRVRFVAALWLIVTLTVPTGLGAVIPIGTYPGRPCALRSAFCLGSSGPSGSSCPQTLGDPRRATLWLFAFFVLLLSRNKAQSFIAFAFTGNSSFCISRLIKYMSNYA